MPNQPTSPDLLLRSKHLPLAAVALVLAILGTTIFIATLTVRQFSRQQFILQNAKVLYSVWLNQEQSEELAGEPGVSERPGDQLWSIVDPSHLPQLDGLIGHRLFDTNGLLREPEPTISTNATVSLQDLALLRKLDPVAHFHPAVDLSDVEVTLTESKIAPVLEIFIPLHAQHQAKLLGIAQFLLQGDKIAEAYATLDKKFILQGGAIFVVSGGLLVLVMQWAFQRLFQLNHLLADRTRSLLRANQELALAAKTSAVGAVTAHLIHGLKNPLSGLQSFVVARGSVAEEIGEEEWKLALASTRRMQSMVAEIVRVLREEEGETAYEMSLSEFAGMVEAKVSALARDAGISFGTELSADTMLTNREANLISLILYNLIHNAIQATPKGKAVELKISAEGARIVCAVKDQGAGIPPSIQKTLFAPCQTTKDGGSGIGLAISKQLANCIEADLELRSSDAAGSVFVLTFNAMQALTESRAKSELYRSH
jgi:signal transduction histidine kinase